MSCSKTVKAPKTEITRRASCKQATRRSLRRSSDMSWKSKLLTYVILLLQLGTSILAIVAMVTNYWGTIPSVSAHFGLHRLCDNQERCSSVVFPGADDVLNLLATVFGLGAVMSLSCGIMELIRTYAFFAFLGGFSFFLALLGFAAMVHSVVVFNAELVGHFNYTFSWSFAMGWMSVLTAVISGALSFYVWWMEPKTTEPSVSASAVIETGTGIPQNTLETNEYVVPPTS
ncbi:claudin domain-containing protein 2-like [Eleutherodactylus coqui]|uniref:claudin domain-containing protein 2-like n=1 Tax=Eleutherodactylus coqui TaxID=57060 RepID=UPI003461DD22